MVAPRTVTILGLSALTLATGLVDAATVIGLDVFTANMTGNVTFLGFSLGGAAGYSLAASLTALVGFVLGAAVAGRMVPPKLTHTAAARGLGVQTLLMAVATLASWALPIDQQGWGAWAVLALLGAAMGYQNVVSLASPIPDMKTTVMTLTIAGLAADAARGRPQQWKLRLLSVVLLLVGATAGAATLVSAGFAATLLVSTIVVGIGAVLLSRSPDEALHPAGVSPV